MSITLLTLVVLVAALVCPAHMLWQMRRGKQASCCGPTRRDELGELARRQRALGEELARRTAADGRPDSDHRVGATPG